MERLTDHKNEHYNQPGCNSCSDYRWRSCKESGEIDDCIQRLTWLRLLAIEDILGDGYDLGRLQELVEADRDGRCVVLLCKAGDKMQYVAEYIDRQLCEIVAEHDQNYRLVVPVEKIRNFPSAEVEPVVHAKDISPCEKGKWFCCSNCGFGFDDYYSHDERMMRNNELNYCPNCGAKMDQ